MDSTTHKLKLTIEDGTVRAELIHPESGCAPPAYCGACGRAVGDDEIDPCYDCSEDGTLPSSECWIQGWVDNSVPEDYMRGVVTVEIPFDARYDEGFVAVVGWPPTPEPAQ